MSLRPGQTDLPLRPGQTDLPRRIGKSNLSPPIIPDTRASWISAGELPSVSNRSRRDEDPLTAGAGRSGSLMSWSDISEKLRSARAKLTALEREFETRGSKKKPKPSIPIKQECPAVPNTLRSHLLEIGDGADVMEEVAAFAGRQQRSVCVLSGHGVIVNPTLRHIEVPPGAVVTLNGPFQILSMSGAAVPSPCLSGSVELTVYFDGGRGQVVGGTAVGKLVAAGPVKVKMTTWSCAGDEPADEAVVNTPDGSDGMQLPEGSAPGFHQAVFAGAPMFDDELPYRMNNTGSPEDAFTPKCCPTPAPSPSEGRREEEQDAAQPYLAPFRDAHDPPRPRRLAPAVADTNVGEAEGEDFGEGVEEDQGLAGQDYEEDFEDDGGYQDDYAT